MASIFQRKNRDGSISYRVQIRRKKIPIFCLTFPTETEALVWVFNNERKYIDDPESYLKAVENNRLKMKRARQFK